MLRVADSYATFSPVPVAQRDRLRMVRLALDGEEKLRIARILGVAKSTVETWGYRYRDGGNEAVRPIKKPGAAPSLDPVHQDRLRARLDAGPTVADGVCTLRGKDVACIEPVPPRAGQKVYSTAPVCPPTSLPKNR